MGTLRSVVGTAKDKIWSQIAADIGGEFIEGGFLGEDVLVYKHGEWQIVLDVHTVLSSTGMVKNAKTYTRMRAPFINKDGLYFKIYREGFFSSLGKFFGMEDMEIGDPFFDEQFIIKGNNVGQIRLLLADEKIKELIQQQPDIHFDIRDDEGFFGTDFPEGVDELYFQCLGEIKETALLKALFELFVCTLIRLVQIDSAYENDPNVRL